MGAAEPGRGHILPVALHLHRALLHLPATAVGVGETLREPAVAAIE
jgi:hypothetical protein